MFIIYRECPKLFAGVQTGFTFVDISNIIFFFLITPSINVHTRRGLI